MQAVFRSLARTGAARTPQAIARTCMTATKPPGPSEPEYPPTYTQSHIAQTRPLVAQRQALPIVQRLSSSEKTTQTPFYWPFGKRKIAQAAETLIYGGLASPEELPLLPLIFKWTQTPDHVACGAGNQGLTIVQYLGSRLDLGSRAMANPGVLFVLLDDLTARTSLLAAPPGMTTFTASFELEFKRQEPVERFVVLDAWITGVEGRKVFVEASAVDAESGEAIVQGKALFVAVQAKK